jgi:hypothetical protein
MVNIVLDELHNICVIDYSSAGDFKPIKINNVKDAKDLILAIKQITMISGEAICLEIKDINGHYTEIERW